MAPPDSKPAPDALYTARIPIFPRRVKGTFRTLKWWIMGVTLAIYYLTPWIRWDRGPLMPDQAVLVDLANRRFFFFWIEIWPQQFIYVAGLLIMAGLGLFLFTSALGRVWCGYTCPQTVWTSIFMWIEQKTEGSRNQRIKLDKAPWSAEKAARKGAKHAGWFFVAFMTGMTFVGYFYPIRELVWELATFSTGKWQALWTVFFTLATYVNAGWMREQVCKFMCPYARFQSVMFDRDTLIVSYDPNRGEPRGSRKRDADRGALGLGDCVDCDLCVQVCPTGIDIRDGLQYECIGCALCIDACDSIMDKMGYPRGLIRYTSENELEGGTTHWLRPRVIGYVTMLIVMIAVFSYNVASRIPLEMTVIRDRNQLFVETADGAIENIYKLHLVNMDGNPHTFTLTIDGIEGAELLGRSRYDLEGGEVQTISLRVRARPETLTAPSTEMTFTAVAEDMPSLRAVAESRFMRPL